MKIAVLASGNGSNLEAIIKKINKKEIDNSMIEVVITDNPNAYAIERAKDHKIKCEIIDYKKYETREKYDKKIISILKELDIELIVLAGYLRWLTDELVNEFKDKIINIHPSLLPSFKGLNGIKKAYEYGVKYTGVTVHFVDNTKDGGPIIFQKITEIKSEDSLEDLEKRIHEIEHEIYPFVINKFIQNKIEKVNRKVTIK